MWALVFIVGILGENDFLGKPGWFSVAEDVGDCRRLAEAEDEAVTCRTAMADRPLVMMVYVHRHAERHRPADCSRSVLVSEKHVFFNTGELMSNMNQDKASVFSEKILDIMNKSMLGLMIGIGYKTGLFEAMSGLPPSTDTIIAEKAKLNERYVREWLAAMVTGRIVDYDSDNRTYSLPCEHAALLTQSAGSNNMAWLAMMAPSLAVVQSDIVESFHRGGGVPYAAYSEFMNLWAEINLDRFNATINQAEDCFYASLDNTNKAA